MTTEIVGDQAGLEVGRKRFLHPGPLRWLRALGWMVLLFVVFTMVYGGAQATGGPLKGSGHPLKTLEVLAICCVGFGLYAGAVRLAEGRWPEELDLRRAPVDLAIGLAIGALMLSAAVGGLYGLGVYDISGPRSASAWGTITMAIESGFMEELLMRAILLRLLMLSAAVGGLYVLGVYDISGPRSASAWSTITMAIESGFMEELLMRAILLRLLMRAFGIWPALVVQAALFGAAHLANPNATPVAAAAIAVEAGLMLAGFYLLTGRLWMSVGVHAAWNFTQGWVWGASVSGIPIVESWLVSTPKPGAPEFLSGGAFGPEASLPAMVVGTVVAVVVLRMAWKKGNFKARPDVAV